MHSRVGHDDPFPLIAMGYRIKCSGRGHTGASVEVKWNCLVAEAEPAANVRAPFRYICRMPGDFFICAEERRHLPDRVLSLIPRRSGCCEGAWATGNSPSHIRVPYLFEGTFREEQHPAGVDGGWRKRGVTRRQGGEEKKEGIEQRGEREENIESEKRERELCACTLCREAKPRKKSSKLRWILGDVGYFYHGQFRVPPWLIVSSWMLIGEYFWWQDDRSDRFYVSLRSIGARSPIKQPRSLTCMNEISVSRWKATPLARRVF